MTSHDATVSVRIDKDIVNKIREISKTKGQTIAGYINVILKKQVERDWEKLNKKSTYEVP